MRVSYQYKNYPGASKKLLLRSQRLGYFTSGTMFMMYAFLWVCIVGGILSSLGLSNILSFVVGIASCYFLNKLLKQFRENQYKKLDDQYQKELEELRRTDPQKYMNILHQLQGSKP